MICKYFLTTALQNSLRPSKNLELYPTWALFGKLLGAYLADPGPSNAYLKHEPSLGRRRISFTYVGLCVPALARTLDHCVEASEQCGVRRRFCVHKDA
jgi:hypothetical protein